MAKSMRFKYQDQIDELLTIGCQLPELFDPNNMQACRFAFSGEEHTNHIPQYMSNPKRMLNGRENMKNLEGYNIDYDFSGFRKIADLIYFEGPFLSHYVSSKGDDYLFYWVDRDDCDNRWLVLRVSLANLQKYVGKEITLRELIEHPNDGYLYAVDVNNDINYHDVKLMQPSSLPEEYLPETDSYYAFDPIPTDDAEELMTYELTIPYKERTRFEEILHKIGFPVSALKKVVSHAAVF